MSSLTCSAYNGCEALVSTHLQYSIPSIILYLAKLLAHLKQKLNEVLVC